MINKTRKKHGCWMPRISSTALLLALCCLTSGWLSMAHSQRLSLRTSKNGQFKYEVFGDDDPGRPALILLHGVSGPALPLYQQQAQFFAEHGYTVLLPHYFEVSKSDASKSPTPTGANYEAWANVVRDLAMESTHREVVVLGFSLGASVALAAGSQLLPVKAIAEWYGSLPDEFFYHLKGMPPLLILHGEHDSNVPVINAQQLIRLCGMKQLTCDSYIYPDQEHGFKGDALIDADARTLAFFSRFVSSKGDPTRGSHVRLGISAPHPALKAEN